MKISELLRVSVAVLAGMLLLYVILYVTDTRRAAVQTLNQISELRNSQAAVVQYLNSAKKPAVPAIMTPAHPAN